ncbi:hypothetical protein Pyn_23487 [Prunus yedoensis var. nudiflora]|uniref:Uncharacterized protein n=1 Tax=Prunus yedoensis var. nudiflora TaxID=2094558 RepID=A0A314ZJ52_PRUYE|nr:hypothetical protein Pyn_23487 [Prunus yedoensis var. nudiflora]
MDQIYGLECLADVKAMQRPKAKLRKANTPRLGYLRVPKRYGAHLRYLRAPKRYEAYWDEMMRLELRTEMPCSLRKKMLCLSA